jgi:cytochrome c biogenesis protein CcmG, thiol:disulfide interchange protein DsbE
MKLITPLILLLALSLPVLAEPALSDIENIALTTESGTTSLAQLRGKTIYLDFWASWCVPCRKSFPWMNEMHRKYKDRGLVIVAVNVDNKRSEATRFLASIPAEFTVAFDPEEKLASAMKLKAMPSSYLISADGKIVERHVGFKEKMMPEYEKSIRTILGLKTETAKNGK